MVFVVFGGVDAVPDVLWGQLYKSQRSLTRLLQLNDFNPLRTAAWSNEKDLNMFVFELESRFLPSVKKHLGPPLEKERDCRNFLAKHINSQNTVAGPYIEGGRWVILLGRRHVDVVALLKEKLINGGRNVGIAKEIAQKLTGGFKIYVNEEISEIYEKNGEFAKFLTDFLSGKPKWLENI